MLYSIETRDEGGSYVAELWEGELGYMSRASTERAAIHKVLNHYFKVIEKPLLERIVAPVYSDQGVTIPSGIKNMIQTALQEHPLPTLCIDYTDATGHQTFGRRVTPSWVQDNTFVAYDIVKAGSRTFRLDRITRCSRYDA